MSNISPHRLSVELNEAFSSDKCQLICIRHAAACLEAGLDSQRLVERRAEIESLIQRAHEITILAREFREAVTELRSDLDNMDDSDDDTDDESDDNDTTDDDE